MTLFYVPLLLHIFGVVDRQRFQADQDPVYDLDPFYADPNPAVKLGEVNYCHISVVYNSRAVRLFLVKEL